MLNNYKIKKWFGINTQLTTTEIDTAREILQNCAPARKALAILEEHSGKIDAWFDVLWLDKNGPPPTYNLQFLHEVTLKVLCKKICGKDDSFRTKVLEYKKIQEVHLCWQDWLSTM